MRPDFRVDEIVITLLSQKKMGFNQILKEIKLSGVPITSRKLSTHLDRLANDEIILRDPNSLPGKPRFNHLHPSIREELELDILELPKVTSKKRNVPDSKQAKNKKLIRLLFAIAATGVVYLVKELKALPGTLQWIDPKTGKAELYSLKLKPGVTVNEVYQGRILSFKKFVGDYTLDEINNYFNQLRKIEVIIPLEEDNGETRFGFKDDKLKEFVLDYTIVLNDIIWVMEETWILLSKKPTTKELEWFSSIFSNKERNRFFTNVQSQRARSTERKSYNLINSYKQGITERIKALTLKYTDIEKRYPTYYKIVEKMIHYPT